MFIKDQNILKCSSCRDGVLDEILFIKDLPLVDSFCNTQDAQKVPTSTVTIRACKYCKTVQIDNPINPPDLYESYI